MILDDITIIKKKIKKKKKKSNKFEVDILRMLSIVILGYGGGIMRLYKNSTDYVIYFLETAAYCVVIV